jgi:hypothetical protein
MIAIALFLSVLPLAQSAETVLGAFIFHRHGDRTTKSYPPTHLTDLGYQQIYQSGQSLLLSRFVEGLTKHLLAIPRIGGFYRERYISSGATQIYGISTDVVKLSQLAVQAPVDNVLQSCAIGLLQGLYPAVGSTLGTQTLANGTSIEAPLNGYQLVPVNELQTAVDNSGDATWLQGSTGCVNAIAASNNYFFSPDYMNLLSKTASFYQSILPVINNTFTAATDTYKNAYTSKC